MAARVRAKVFVRGVSHYAWNDGGLTVEFGAVSRGEENKSWSAATPQADLKMVIKNPLAADVFHDAVGKEFWMDLTPVEE